MTMQEADSTEIAQEARRTARGRRLLLLMALVVLAPFVLAVYLSSSGWRPSGSSVNFGELVEPARPLPAVALRTPQGQPASTESLRGRWVLLTVAQSACTVTCRRNLWKMQQVRLAQGQHMRRVERVLLLDSRARTPAAALMREYPGTQVLIGKTADLAPLVRVLADRESVGDRLFLIDPNGNLVLRYAPNADTTGLRKDLGRLLRLSQIG